MEASVKITIGMMTVKILRPLVTGTSIMITAIPFNPRLPWPIREICCSRRRNSSWCSSRMRKWSHHHYTRDQKTSSRSCTQNTTVEVQMNWRPSLAPFALTSELTTTLSQEGIPTKFSTRSITSEARSMIRMLPNDRRAWLTIEPGATTYSPMTTHAYTTTIFLLPKSRSITETQIGSTTHPPKHTTKWCKATTTQMGIYAHTQIDSNDTAGKPGGTRSSIGSCCTMWSGLGWNLIFTRSWGLLPMQAGDSTPSTSLSTQQQTLKHHHQITISSNDQPKVEVEIRRERRDHINHTPRGGRAQHRERAWEQNLARYRHSHLHLGLLVMSVSNDSMQEWAWDAEWKAINLGNAQNTHPPRSPNRSQQKHWTQMKENATSNANDCSIRSNEKTSPSLPASG